MPDTPTAEIRTLKNADGTTIIYPETTTEGVYSPSLNTNLEDGFFSNALIYQNPIGVYPTITPPGGSGSGDSSASLPSQTGNAGKFLTTNGTTASWANVNALPSQSGNSGKFLTTNGSTASWTTVDTLPSQSGNSGKVLSTNGTTASWTNAPTELFIAEYDVTSYADVLAAYNAGKTIICKKPSNSYTAVLQCYQTASSRFDFVYPSAYTNVYYYLDQTHWWSGVANCVPTSRTVNGKALSSNITLSASDVGAVNPNLLDNWYFVGGGSQQGGGQFPINTRRKTSYSGAVQYTIDSWKTSNANTTVAIGSAGVTISASSGTTPYLLNQIANIEPLRGNIVTLSIMVGGICYSASTTIPASNPSEATLYATISGIGHILYMSNAWYVRLQGPTGGNQTYTAVKLELGSTQTLAHQENGVWVLNEIPNYEEQMVRCGIIETIPRPNLLDNWYFVGGGSQQGEGQFPINTQGQTSYSDVNGYSIDRWAIQTTRSLTLGSNGITVTPTSTNNGRIVVQGLPGIPLLGKTITVSILCTSSEINNVYVGIFGNTNYMSAYDTYISQNSRIADGNGVYLLSATVNMPNDLITSSRDKLTFGFGFYNTGTIVPSFTVIAAKLEYGNTQTLAHQENGVWVLNEIPDYNEQMLRCNEGFGSFSQIETGSYVGTGTRGSDNPNSITFKFKPKLVIMGRGSSSLYTNMAFVDVLTSTYSNPGYSLMWSVQSGYPIYGKIDGTTLSWYNSNGGAAYQLNETSITYHYIAIG